MITRSRAIGIVLFSTAGLMLAGSSAHAQSGSQSFGSKRVNQFSARSGVGQFSSQSVRNQLSSRSVGGARSPKPNLGSYKPPASGFSSKPFSSVSRTPTVSPYLALNNSFNQVSDYYNIVRPQRDQQRVNQQLLRQNLTNQRRLNKLAAQGPYSPQGNANSAPTGHSAVFQSLGAYLQTGGYYSGAPVPR